MTCEWFNEKWRGYQTVCNRAKDSELHELILFGIKYLYMNQNVINCFLCGLSSHKSFGRFLDGHLPLFERPTKE